MRSYIIISLIFFSFSSPSLSLSLFLSKNPKRKAINPFPREEIISSCFSRFLSSLSLCVSCLQISWCFVQTRRKKWINDDGDRVKPRLLVPKVWFLSVSLFLCISLWSVWVWFCLCVCFAEVSSIEWEAVKMSEEEEDLISRMYKLVGDRSETLSLSIHLIPNIFSFFRFSALSCLVESALILIT